MGFFSGRKAISIPRRNLQEEVGMLTNLFQQHAPGIVQSNVAADTAFTQAQLGAASQFGPQIRELQQQLNPELFAGIGRQEALAEQLGAPSEIGAALQKEALSRIGTGITPITARRHRHRYRCRRLDGC